MHILFINVSYKASLKVMHIEYDSNRKFLKTAERHVPQKCISAKIVAFYKEEKWWRARGRGELSV